MNKEEFIERWNVAFENKEQQMDFYVQMGEDLDMVIANENALLLEQIKELKEQLPKWISARDMLPDERIFPCLAINMDVPEYSQHIICATYYAQTGRFKDEVRNKILEFITHWMPLPNTPTE